jgi:hypothetical protein
MDRENRMRLVMLSLAVSWLTPCPAAAGQLLSERNDVMVIKSPVFPCQLHCRRGVER